MKCGGFFVHTMKHCYATATEAQTLSITHARINHKRSMNAENEPVSRIKMADYRALVSMGTL